MTDSNILPFVKPPLKGMILPDPHDPDGTITYVTGEIPIDMDELFEAIRQSGLDITRCVVTDDGEVLRVAND